MRLGQYLEIGKKMKTARTNAGINQRDMAKQLKLLNSSYSNYENGYSEPPVEVILKFCDILKISFEDLLQTKISQATKPTVETFADFISIIIDLDRRGLPISANTTYSTYGNQLTAHLTFDLVNAQIAAFIPNWNKINSDYKKGKMSQKDYDAWLENILRLYNVPIDEYIYPDLYPYK